MGLYDIVKKDIFKNQDYRKNGKFIGVPIPFERLQEYIPIIERGHSIGVLGATGSGKSRFTRFLFIYHCYKFAKQNNYPLKIIYLPLEDNKEKVYLNMICHYLYELYDIYISLQELSSKGKRVLPDFVKEKIEEAEDFFKEFEEIVTVVDGLNEPTEIYEYFESYAKANGRIESYVVDVNGSPKKQYRYVANNDVHTIGIVDNMSNIDIENGAQNEREAIVKFCKKYTRGRLCNFFNFTMVQVLQQDFQSERQSFTRDGESIVGKLEPSLAGIGDAKTIARSMHLVLGIFHPARFGLMQYPIPSKRDPNNTYRLDILGNRFRTLHILKANDTDFGFKVAFNFDAVTENMTELPLPQTDELKQIYERILKKNPEQFSKIRSVINTQEDNEPEEEEAPF